jgi:integrase
MTTMNSPSAPQKPKLLDRVREAIRARHYSRRTEDAYLGWIKRAVKEAVRRAGIAKLATPHTFRHSGVYPAFVRDYSPP